LAQITSEPAEAPQTKILDLMAALKASLAEGGTESDEAAPAKSKRKTAS